MKRVVLSAFVWPEPESSGAGVKSQQLLSFFRSEGLEIWVHSGAKPGPYSERLKQQGMQIFSCEANDSRFDEWIKEVNPDLVVFDRFMMEEQFSWRVRQNVPNALRVVDTIDFHALRRYRELVQTENRSFAMNEFLSQPDTLRELASYSRSDLNLIISKYEYTFLKDDVRFAENKMFYLPICAEPLRKNGYETRKDFSFIGNQRHAPNEDALNQLLEEIWPQLSARTPDARLKIAGAYPIKAIEEKTKKFKNVDWLGSVANSVAFLSETRVQLAPLRFGAGLKGKVLDSFSAGTPVITSNIGAEGLDGFPDECLATNSAEMIEQAVHIYEKQALWDVAQLDGFSILEREFSPSVWFPQLSQALKYLFKRKDEIRKRDWIQNLLWREQFRSTEYFSRWIEQKNVMKRDEA